MKNYLLMLFLMIGLSFGATGVAQTTATASTITTDHTDLVIYPNPVSNGKIYITTKQNLTKEVEIFDVLGKKILFHTLYGKELNISRLNPGIYIIKIKEGSISTTRKLVVR
ncbi:putative secreted protein (Por secretion system target) [Gelidibacter sediminis]|uniref:Putative secreted protein (Por secretion system target) n=1 Tax=Gelidibacter sediminis TaxID=1608710 RepID=A0A4R7Q6D5_9FLAO|nr:T9SS type A sorting domain-containing protein [Gelidibacter sediminis]TDU43135.1 putative secreted protein (Por secretion system target) [Gelidibacter sediminis]